MPNKPALTMIKNNVRLGNTPVNNTANNSKIQATPKANSTNQIHQAFQQHAASFQILKKAFKNNK